MILSKILHEMYIKNEKYKRKVIKETIKKYGPFENFLDVGCWDGEATLDAISLTKVENQSKEIINLPISSMLNLANKTINDYIENLNESDKNQVLKLFSTNERDLQGHYNIIKEEVIDKLTNHKENSDSETSKKIDETINKVKSEKFDRLNYVKLKSLNEQL